MRAGRVGAVAAAGLVLAAAAAPGAGQEAGDDARALRRAASLESRGRYAEAREVLEALLAEDPTSSGALFSLERVLRPLGAVRGVLPHAGRFLESDPRAPGVRYLQLRVLSEIDSVAGLEAAVADWIAADPSSPEPWREGARLFEERFGPERALELLGRGREAVGSPSALALETGDVLMRTGEPVEAAREWAAAVGPDGGGLADVLRRVEGAGAGRSRLVDALLDRLDEEPTGPDRRRAGIRIALAAGRAERAVELAGKVVPGLEGLARRGFLAELASRGEEAGLAPVTVWALRTLRDDAGAGRERLALDRQIATTALQAGDTALALDAQLAVARALEPGSAERRRAVFDLIRVEAASDDVDAERLLERLEGFRSEFPGAPELDALASAVAAGLRARGRGGDAARVVEGVSGPRSALERAFLLFEEGSVEEGVEALLAAVPGLEPAGATGAIQLAAVLERASPPAAGLLARIAARAHRGRVDDALDELDARLDEVPAGDRPAVLAHGARVAADGGRPERAASLRERLLADHPEAPEVADATLALARWHARSPARLGEAVRLLEELILRRPDSPVVPAARRELARLRSDPAGAGGTS